jgi:hypothetical protein
VRDNHPHSVTLAHIETGLGRVEQWALHEKHAAAPRAPRHQMLRPLEHEIAAQV